MRGTLIAVAAVAMVAGCSTYDSVTQKIAQSITPYRITVVQGNFVSREAAAQMQVGMSRAQVRQLLGTPLLTDMFHADRWDYLFYFKRGSTSVVQQRDFIVHFENDRVASWSGGEDLPSNLELLADIDGDKAGKKVKVASAASGASAPAAAAASEASAPVAAASPPPSTPDTALSPTGEAAQAGSLPPEDPNAQAAQAANRLTNAVQAPGKNTTPSVRAGNPQSNGGVPQNATAPGQPQFHFQRPPPPQIQGVPQDNPVGPAGPQNGDSQAPAPAPAPAQSQPSS
ncbi:outer membrane protein assembly factor BamE [Paraburkholderia rhizosphaerae]|nr:outer membrane protein assembly factor BamE [Paraburkholderia rhizosphaerae]